MQKFKMHSSLTNILASCSALSDVQYFTCGTNHENLFPKLSIYLGHNFNTVSKLVRNNQFM